MTDSFVVDRNLIVLLLGEGRLSGDMLSAYNRPEAEVGAPARKRTPVEQTLLRNPSDKKNSPRKR